MSAAGSRASPSTGDEGQVAGCLTFEPCLSWLCRTRGGAGSRTILAKRGEDIVRMATNHPEKPGAKGTKARYRNGQSHRIDLKRSSSNCSMAR